MWLQRAEADMKYQAQKGNNTVQAIMEEEMKHLSCIAAIALATELI